MIIGNQHNEAKYIWSAMAALRGQPLKFMKQFKDSFGLTSPLPVYKVAGYPQVDDAINNFTVYAVNGMFTEGIYRASNKEDVRDTIYGSGACVVSDAYSGSFTSTTTSTPSASGGTARTFKGITLESSTLEGSGQLELTTTIEKSYFSYLGLALVQEGIPELQTERSIMLLRLTNIVYLPEGATLNLDEVMIYFRQDTTDDSFAYSPYGGHE